MAISTYRKSRAESDRFVDEAKRIIAQHMIRVGTENEDNNHATDIVCEPGAFALRTRSLIYTDFTKYHREFTIRSKRPTGTTTELQKILDGDADYYLYAWVNDHNIVYYTIFDLNVFRETVKDQPALLFNTVMGRDGVTFTCFDYGSFPPEFIIYSNLPGISVDEVSNSIVFDAA